MLLAAVLLGLAAASGQEAPGRGVTLRLDLRLAPVRALEQAVGSPLAMGLVEGLLGACRNAADVRAAFETLPETARLRSGRGLILRAPALDEETLAAIGTDLARWLGLAPGELQLPVVLVTRAPEPGAFTHRSRDGALTFVAVADETLDTGLLCEIVVHEAIQALDVSPLGRDSLLAELRRALLGRGVGPTDPLQRDAVHTLFFLAAAEAVRRHVDPEHRDYGDVRGYYARAGKAAEVARAPWSADIAGERSREELVEALAPTERR